jgi:hypothetical protein
MRGHELEASEDRAAGDARRRDCARRRLRTGRRLMASLEGTPHPDPSTPDSPTAVREHSRTVIPTPSGGPRDGPDRRIRELVPLENGNHAPTYARV